MTTTTTETFAADWARTRPEAEEIARRNNEQRGREVFYARHLPSAGERLPQGFPWEITGRRYTVAGCGCIYDEQAEMTSTWCEEHDSTRFPGTQGPCRRCGGAHPTGKHRTLADTQ